MLSSGGQVDAPAWIAIAPSALADYRPAEPVGVTSCGGGSSSIERAIAASRPSVTTRKCRCWYLLAGAVVGVRLGGRLGSGPVAIKHVDTLST